MMDAIDEQGGEVGRRALSVQARALGKEPMDPWDLFAPAPSPADGGASTRYTFEEAIVLIKDALAEVDPEMSDFVQMMVDKGWIEAGEGDTKRPGAYCTKFSKSREPRVYMSSYTGGASHVLTLAHELGHAFHNWVMRDLPLAQSSYPMNLAETASLMFETVVGDALVARASSPEETFRYGWTDAESAVAFMLNIPARFRFEHAMYERRREVCIPGRAMRGGMRGDDPQMWVRPLQQSHLLDHAYHVTPTS